MTQKKYQNPITTSLRSDRAIVNFAHKIGLELSEAFIIGLKSHVQNEVEEGRIDATVLTELNRMLDAVLIIPDTCGEYAGFVNSYEHKRWADAVKTRDHMKCRNCGSYKDIQAHHIKSIAMYPELRLDINNGVTLCKKCHRIAHSDIRDHLMFENIAGVV